MRDFIDSGYALIDKEKALKQALAMLRQLDGERADLKLAWYGKQYDRKVRLNEFLRKLFPRIAPMPNWNQWEPDDFAIHNWHCGRQYEVCKNVICICSHTIDKAVWLSGESLDLIGLRANSEQEAVNG